MEKAPARWRGIFSGILQSGYSIGYLVAALASRFILPAWGWRGMFWVGGIPALLALYIRAKVPESEAWKQHHAPSPAPSCKPWPEIGGFLLSWVAHDTHALPLAWHPGFVSRFLKSARGFASAAVSYIAILYNVGAVMGAIIFGHLSEKLGRRFGMIAALLVSLCMIPAWAFGSSWMILAFGAFLLQDRSSRSMGIIPAHLNELSPDAVRGIMPGVAYQLGILLAAGTNTLEYALRDKLGYGWALSSFEVGNILLLIVVVALGSERKGKVFYDA